MSKHEKLSQAEAAKLLSQSISEARKIEHALCNLYAGVESASQQLLSDAEGCTALPDGDRMGFLFGFLSTSNHMMYLQRDLSEILDRAESAICTLDWVGKEGGLQHG